MGTLLVHVVGESDLHLSSRPPTGEDCAAWDVARPARVQSRLTRVASLLPQDGRPASDLAEATRLLVDGGWDDDAESTGRTGPLFAALEEAGAEGEVDVVLVGTRQEPPHPLDTWPIADGLKAALDAGVAERVGRVEVVCAPGLGEGPVAGALGDYLLGRQVTPGVGARALVTWGSGSTSLALGCLTALSRAGAAWLLVDVSGADGAADVVDPLDDLGVDPVAGVLVRWRMFGVLDDLAAQEPPPVRLSSVQRELVRRCAERSRDALVRHDADALRVVVADAVVRRDGTAGLAVRRYVEVYYGELLELDRAETPQAKNLLDWIAEENPGRKKFPLGQRIWELKKKRKKADPRIAAELASPAGQWLLGDEVADLRTVGTASHELRPPEIEVAARVGACLRKYDVDGPGWADSGLPAPPVVPTNTVLAVWASGNSPKSRSFAVQLEGGVPGPVRDYLSGEPGPDSVPLRAVIFGTAGEGGSLGQAATDAERLNGAVPERASAESIDMDDVSAERLEEQIEARLGPEVGALLMLPPGPKPVALALVRVMRLVGARHGLPLFVSDMADPPAAQEGSRVPGVHLWPALTGGDLALLVAARQALQSLELDVAWRLLAASGIADTEGETARRLAAAFTCRAPMDPDQWPDPAPTADLHGRTLGMAAQRLDLVRGAGEGADPADQVRLLVLAGGALEVSVAAEGRLSCRGKKAYPGFREELEASVKVDGPVSGRVSPEMILLLLNQARDRASITHGNAGEADQAVAQAAGELVEQLSLTSTAASGLPRDVKGLLGAAVGAAESLLGPLPSPGDPSLKKILAGLLENVGGAIALRQQQ
jgi:hypothetical protein